MSEKLIDKIRKLLALSQHNSNEAEAAAAASKVQQLLAEHNLSMADLAEEERSDIERHTYDPGYADPWRRSIVFSAARLYMCQAINTEVHYTTTSRKHGTERLAFRRAFIFVGREHNVAVAREMCDYLFAAVVRLAREYSTERSERLAFERGCGERLAERLDEMWTETRSRKPTDPDKSGLPALYATENELVQRWIDENMRLGKMRARGSSLDHEHSAAGAAAGDRVSLSPQVRGGGSRALLT